MDGLVCSLFCAEADDDLGYLLVCGPELGWLNIFGLGDRSSGQIVIVFQLHMGVGSVKIESDWDKFGDNLLCMLAIPLNYCKNFWVFGVQSQVAAILELSWKRTLLLLVFLAAMKVVWLGLTCASCPMSSKAVLALVTRSH